MGSRMVHACDRCGNEVLHERQLVEFSVKRRQMDEDDSVWVTIEEAQKLVRRFVEPLASVADDHLVYPTSSDDTRTPE